jgi:hypothetical protein
VHLILNNYSALNSPSSSLRTRSDGVPFDRKRAPDLQRLEHDGPHGPRAGVQVEAIVNKIDVAT